MTNAAAPLKSWEKPEVYRAYRPDGTLLYVGSTHCYAIRAYQHKTDSPWWAGDLFWLHEVYPTMAEARATERAAIKAEHPLTNGRGLAVGNHAPTTVAVSILRAAADEEERQLQANLDIIAEAVTH